MSKEKTIRRSDNSNDLVDFLNDLKETLRGIPVDFSAHMLDGQSHFREGAAEDAIAKVENANLSYNVVASSKQKEIDFQNGTYYFTECVKPSSDGLERHTIEISLGPYAQFRLNYSTPCQIQSSQ